MLAEVVSSQSFCKAICKHVSTADLFNHELAIGNQLSDIIVLDIDVFGPGLTLGIFGEDDTSLIISV